VGQQLLYSKQNAVVVYRSFDGISPMTPLAGKRAIATVRDLLNVHQKIRENAYYFMTRFINSREGEIINILDSSYRLPVYRHIGQWSTIDPLFPIPIHS